MIAAVALQEDVDAVGISILSGAHNTLCPRIIELLGQNGMDDTLVLVHRAAGRYSKAQGDRRFGDLFAGNLDRGHHHFHPQPRAAQLTSVRIFMSARERLA